MGQEALLTLASVSLILVTVLPNFIDVPIHFAMLCTSFCVIIVAAHRSLAVNSNPETAGQVERISTNDAYQFPLVASAGLFSLFIVFTFFKKYVTVLLTIYSLVLGSGSVGSFLFPVLKLVLPTGPAFEFNLPSLPSLPAPVQSVIDTISGLFESEADRAAAAAAAEAQEEGEDDGPVKTCLLEVVCYIIGFGFGGWYYFEEHWTANNILGSGLAITGIEYINVGSFMIGSILLSGLFFYDIFWVFLSKPLIGKNVMVTVAKNFKGPIKFLFKKPMCTPKLPLCSWDTVKNVSGACIATATAALPEYNATGLCPKQLEQAACDAKLTACFSLLGLGDVVLPGIFIALLLRFDESRTNAKGEKLNSRFYFHAVLVAYLLGLVATYVAMIWMDHAQPALLYLVPACIGVPSLCALVRGEWKELFAYDEEALEAAEEEAAEADGKDEKKEK